MDASNKKHERRRRKWIRPDLQLKIIVVTIFLGVLVAFINFLINLIGLSMVPWSSVRTVETVIHELRYSLMRNFFLSVALTIPLAIWLGTVYSFKFCGPIYRFKKYFTELLSGRWDQPCTLRKGDDLQDVKDAINKTIGLLAGRIRGMHEVLLDARRLLESSQVPQDELRRLLERIDAVSADAPVRFGPGAVKQGEAAPQPAAAETVAAAG